MYNNMLFAMKRRILQEVEGAFLNHPVFAQKVTVTNKFPYNERLQYGVVIRNSSASQVRLSADNYLAELWSHVRLARNKNIPGISLEWVREDAPHVTERVKDENVSDQLGTTQRRFYTAYPIVAGVGDTHYASRPDQVLVTINGVPVVPEYVNGKERMVMLQRSPSSNGDIVLVTYEKRKISLPGIYLVDFTADNQFYVTPTGIVTSEIVIDVTTGTESTTRLANENIRAGTLSLYIVTLSGEASQELVQGTDYSIDFKTGQITFLKPLSSNLRVMADYKWEPGISTGPYTVNNYQEVHNAIPGVVLCVGRRAKAGDMNLVLVSQFREEQARVYGGHWEMSLNLGVISKDPAQMEEMTDQVVNHLWGIRKNALEFEGITLIRVEPTGETEETYLDTTGDLYYESSVDIAVQTEWQEFVPYLYSIKNIFVDNQLRETLSMRNYTVREDGGMIVEPDIRPVIRYATMGYERVI